MPSTGKERAALRAEAHHLDPLVHIGQHGITPAVVQSLKDVIRTKELVKLQVARTSETTAKDTAPLLAARIGATVVQVIGRTFTLYKHNPAIKRTDGDTPPWRR